MDIKSLLNESQYLSASSTSQYLRIVAGAGTGKTRTLTYRIAYLISQGILPKRILAITFTNKAAKEMLSRVEQLLDENDFNVTSKPTMSTFHSFCYKFLKKEIALIPGYSTNFNIAEEEDQGQIFKDIFSRMTKGSSKEFTKSVVNKISSLKTRGIFVNQVTSDEVSVDSIYTYTELLSVYSKYQDFLRSQNLLDFDDLLMLAVKILEENEHVRKIWQDKYDVILVDEFQDTNDLQYNLVRYLLGKDTKLTVVGDPDQTIYTWRGARGEIIKDVLKKDFPTLETIVLDKNYRSTQSILNAANSLIKNNSNRLEKDLISASEQVGDKVEYTNYPNEENEAYSIANKIYNLTSKQNIPFNQIAVIYRSNYLSNSLEKMLTRFKVPYEIYGGMKFYERAEIKDALAYLRLVINPDDLSFRRMLKAPTKSIGDVALNKAIDIKNMVPEEDALLFTIFRKYRDEMHLMSKSKLALDDFYNAYDKMLQVYQTYHDNEELITAINNYFIDTGFMEYVHKEDKKLEEKLSYTAASSISKTANVEEFLNSITTYLEQDVLDEDGNVKSPTLEDFLIEVALQSDQDTMKDSPKVSLMTGHVSKGLEFPYVFITGLNQGIFPTNHALKSLHRSAIEEERRLLYVCVTRAQTKLFLSSFSGFNSRSKEPNIPSMFIRELQLIKKDAPKNNYEAFVGSLRPRASLFSNMSGNAQAILSSVSNPQARNQSKDTYQIGDKVIHTSFGIGVVKEVLPDNKIIVQFKEEIGEKKLMVGFKAFRKMTKEEEA